MKTRMFNAPEDGPVCWVFGAAPQSAPVVLDRRPGPEDFVIAADGGLRPCGELGLTPHLLLGDLDSLGGNVPAGVPLLRLPVEKDDTDTMAAIRHAAAQEECGEIWLYCALGGRLDHLLGNLQAVAFAVRRGIPARIVDEENEILVFSGGSVTVPERAGYSLSVLALSDRCTGVSIHGTKYELEHVTVENSFPIGMSNQWRGTAEITVEQGVLAVIESKM